MLRNITKPIIFIAICSSSLVACNGTKSFSGGNDLSVPSSTTSSPSSTTPDATTSSPAAATTSSPAAATTSSPAAATTSSPAAATTSSPDTTVSTDTTVNTGSIDGEDGSAPVAQPVQSGTAGSTVTVSVPCSSIQDYATKDSGKDGATCVVIIPSSPKGAGQNGAGQNGAGQNGAGQNAVGQNKVGQN